MYSVRIHFSQMTDSTDEGVPEPGPDYPKLYGKGSGWR